jgi:hypothetical protein
MNKKLLFRTIYSMLALMLVISIINCNDTHGPVTPIQYYLSGTITFTNPTPPISGGYYAVSFYGDSSNPFGHQPVKTDSLPISTFGGVSSVNYQPSGLPYGTYYIGCTWIHSTNHQILGVLGTRGCDTSQACALGLNDARVSYSSTERTDNITFLSWTDVSHRIH